MQPTDLQLDATMVWLIVLSSFKMDDFYTLIYGYIYVWFLQKHYYIYNIIYAFGFVQIRKNLSSKTQIGFIA